MLNLNNVYNYYSAHLISSKSNDKVGSHKRNDLKTIYNNMVKQNQHSPVYTFTFSGTTQAYAIGIKEAAIALEAESLSLGNHDEIALKEMMAVSDNENIIYANLNDGTTESLPDKLSIKVDSLATGQVNVGTYLPSGGTSFRPGNYSFGIAIKRNQYTFNLTVHKGDTNLQIQQNLAASINNNHIGVRASIRNRRQDSTSALVLRSDEVGIDNNDDLIFRFDESYLETDISSILGIDNVESLPSNAEFYINDTRHISASNHISLNHSLDVDLLSVSDSPVTVHLVPDKQKISDKLDDFLDSYNELVDIARNTTNQKNASRLFRDITSITRNNQKELTSAGLAVDEYGYLKQIKETDSGQILSLFDEELSSFRKDVKRITGKMMLNPLDYIDKTVVTYPNTSGTYPNPYHPSRYSGLLFNDYA